VFGFKLLLALAILAAGALGGAIPLLQRRTEASARWLRFGDAFAAGVILGAGLIHLLPEAAEIGRGLAWSSSVVYAAAAGGFLLMLLCEHVLLPERAHEMMQAPSSERFALLPPNGAAGLTAYSVLVALSAHSFLAGLALGAEPEFAGAVVLAIAILMHKSLGGFALGVSLVRHPMPPTRAWTLLGLFAIATPLGIGVGAALGASVEGATRDAIEAIFLSLAAGTFAYVAIVDLLRDEHESRERLQKWLVASGGTALMAALAPWV
jgi:zinc transporter 1/2/3